MTAKRAALARARKATGFSQETLADALGVDPSTVRRWEAGDSAPQPWLRPGLADLLGVNRDTLAELLTLESANASMSASTASSVIGQQERIQASQEDWLHVRRAPGVRGRELTELVLQPQGVMFGALSLVVASAGPGLVESAPV
ncbi:MAG: helix-turn-helix domain-containing protein [Actinomycetota bacterium]|nr:helix-turn-helix domain-containing protein [Actinomycetota bacterium]